MKKGHIEELWTLAREIEQKASWHDGKGRTAETYAASKEHLHRAVAYWACFDELSQILGDIEEGAE